MREVNIQNLWNFEWGSHENMNVPIWIKIRLQPTDGRDTQNLNNDTFCRLPVTSAQCIFGTEKYPDAGIVINYDDDDYTQGYHQTKEVFKTLTEDDILQPFKSGNGFKSSTVRADDVGYCLYVFKIRYQNNFTASQPIKVEFEFDGVVPPDINGYALVLTNKLVSISLDGEGHLIWFEVKFNFFMTASFSFIVISVFFSVKLRYNALIKGQCENSVLYR